MPGTPHDAADYLHALFPEADVVAFHYRGYRAERPARPAPRRCARTRSLIHDYRARAAPARAHRRGRLQHRQRRRRLSRRPPPARRPDPGHAVRFARRGRGRPLSLAAGPAAAPPRDGAGRGPSRQPGAGRDRSPGGVDTDRAAGAHRGAAPRHSQSRLLADLSPMPATTTFTTIPAFGRRCARR